MDHAIFESSPHGIIVADGAGRFVMVNGAACRLTGYAREELLERGVADLAPADAQEPTAEHSTFTVYLPRSEASPDVPVAEEEPQELRGNECILVVEDAAAVRALAEAVLLRHGYEVTAVASPAEAVALLATDGPRFDLLLTDVVMPGMNGVQLHRRLVGFGEG